VLNQVLKDRRVELVVNRLAFAFGDHEAAGAEHREVPRDGGPARVELIGDLPGRAGPGAEVVEDLPACLVRERAEDRVRRPLT
jgi:hypothetical protein